MSISYSKEKDAWSMKDVTEEEKEVLLECGSDYLAMMIGAAILKQASGQEQLHNLTPPNDLIN